MSEDKESKKAREAATMAENVNILMLQETIKNLEESKIRLLLTIKELKEKLDQHKADQADIYYYLNKKCDESFDIIANLEEQLSNEQSDREIAEKMYEGRIDELKSILSGTETKMSARIIDLEGKVDMLNQFAHAKEETDRKLAELTQTLDREREDNQQTIEILENKFLIEREKLRASYDQKYEMLKKDLEQSIDGKLSKKTQRTQIMNVVMKKELEAQSRHADRLLEINDEIVERDKKLKIELDLARSLKDELLRKCNMYTRSNKDLEKKVSDIKEEQETLRKQLEEQLKSKTSETDELRQLLIKERGRNNQKVGKIDELWFFLSKAYQILGINRKAQGSIDEQSADYYSNVLFELFKHLSVKSPEFMVRFMNDQSSVQAASSQLPRTQSPSGYSSVRAGMSIASVPADERSVVSKDDVGIFSWRTERFADPRPARPQIQTRSQGVQTDYQYAMDNQLQQPNSSRSYAETGSLWKPYGGQLSVDEGSSGSVGVFSLPTVLGGHGDAGPAVTGKKPVPHKIGTAKNGLNTFSLISAVTQDDSQSLLDSGDSIASNSVQSMDGAGQDPLFDHSFHTVSGPVQGRKPLNRSSSHQTKTRKLKFLDKQSQSGSHNMHLGNNSGSNIAGGFLLDDWQDGYYIDRSSKGLYGGSNGTKALMAPGLGLEDSSSNVAGFMDLSVSGRRFHDQQQATHPSHGHHHVVALPKLA